MTKQQFLEELKDILEVDYDLNEESILEDIDSWDSFAFVSIVVFFKNELNIKIDVEDLVKCVNVGDVLKLAKL